MEDALKHVRKLEASGELDPNCIMCIREFYPFLYKGGTIADIYAPRHKPSDKCESGKKPHCTCDTCF